MCPWAYVCGYPTSHGDLYGGSLYLPSSCAELTPQGIAIQDVANRFGNGQTLPFTPCKRGYIPIVRGENMYGCHLHHRLRKARVHRKENGGSFRNGEFDLQLFWNNLKDKDKSLVLNEEEGMKNSNFDSQKKPYKCG